jgi:hypothetical protein
VLFFFEEAVVFRTGARLEEAEVFLAEEVLLAGRLFGLHGGSRFPGGGFHRSPYAHDPKRQENYDSDCINKS